MGIRVNKMIGYGLTDVRTRKYMVADSRINRKSILLDYDREESANTDDYFAWADSQPSDKYLREFFGTRRSQYPGVPDDDPFRAVVHETEYGLRNVLCLRPVGSTDWSRSDDIIDWIEESDFPNGHGEQENNVRLIPHGIYPFDSYMNAETGERFTAPLGADVRMFRQVANGSNRSNELLEYFAQEAGFADAAEAERLIVPAVPADVRGLAEFGQLFTGPNVWKQLRPMIYTYWG